MKSNIQKVVIGLDFGSDSVRGVLFRVENGEELKHAAENYERWGRQQYCDPVQRQFRQHPRDHAEAMTRVIRRLLADGSVDPRDVVGIGVDTTGSSPMPVAANAQPLGMFPEFADDPNALCVLWKDHTAVAEAEEINTLCHSGRIPDYTRYVGGIYSSEWFWAKLLHVFRASPKVQAATASWVELCDWIPALLTGVSDAQAIVRSRCAAGHKALWHPEFGGLPGRPFLAGLDERLLTLPYPLYTTAVPSDHSAGRLCPEWADRLGLPVGVVVAVGAFDCHMGAVGAGVTPYTLARVMGTSTCDILIAPDQEVGKRIVHGICGQVPDSALPGYIGFEAGQSSFGDCFAWFRDLLTWNDPSPARRDTLLRDLAEAARLLPPGAHGEAAIDWLNGRRTPDADQRVKAAIMGLQLGSTAPAIYRALLEAVAYGSRAIVDRFEDEGIPVKRIIALGGIPAKSPLLMQISADVLNRPVEVVESTECCARGAAIFAATAAGEYRWAAEAQQAMQSAIQTTYTPDPATAARYRELYQGYQALATFAQGRATPQGS
ncbi:MAG: ribulokinase [Azospirillaceae bacterium]|nr:ribulokinase [Azospirillaceae bacterium]